MKSGNRIHVSFLGCDGPSLDIRKLALFVLESQAVQGKSLSVVFLKGLEMRKLNKRYRGKDFLTDVLSFGFESGKEPFFGDDSLGEICICPYQVRWNAKRAGVSTDQEMARVLVHGILHLLGYDHDDGADVDEVMAQIRTNGVAESDMSETQRMFALQERILGDYFSRA